MATSTENATPIPTDEVSFHAASIGSDPNARLFEWQGELYRAIGGSYAETCRALLSSDAVRRLRERRALVGTEQAAYSIDGYELVLRHRRLPFVSYPFEWCGPMLKDAALALLDINLELVEDGYMTKDPSAWNVLFDGARPVYVDFSNIWPLEWMSYAHGLWPEWFAKFYLHPLLLMSRGNTRIVRWLLRDVENGIGREEFLKFGFHPAEQLRKGGRRAIAGARRRAGKRLPAPVRAALRRTVRGAGGGAGKPQASRAAWSASLADLKRRVEAIEIPVPKTKWSGYYELSLSPAAPIEGLSAKHGNVEAVLRRLQPRSVLDIGSSTGWFSRLAAELGADVVVVDADESCVAIAYRQAKEQGLSILPLVMDLRSPSPAYGLCNRRVASAGERLGAEMTFALALVHHLVFGQHMDFDQIAESLSLFAKRWLLVEFVAGDDAALRSLYPDQIPWYTRERFLEALGVRFEVREVLESHPASRELVLCERR